MRFVPQEYRRRRACVLGLGRSGQAAAALLVKKGFKVFATDLRPRQEIKTALKGLASKIAWEGGKHSDRALQASFAVKSPGVPSRAPILEKLKTAGIPIFSELETALAFSPTPDIMAITGTNGKTTTTALVAEMFGHRRAPVAGNIGTPLCGIIGKIQAKDTLILEVSSYQLEDSQSFHPQAAALLNITPEHLEHHGGMPRYIEAKARLFAEQTGDDFCVFNAEDPLVLKLSRRAQGRRLYFGRQGTYTHCWVEGRKIKVRLPGVKEISFTPPQLPGAHNLDNAMAAILLGLGWGLKAAAVQKALKAFRGVPHRLEEAGTARGLRCVNDSKATNVDSTMTALKTFSKKNVLVIMGGLHKGNPYTTLRPLIESTVKGILAIGSAAPIIEKDLSGLVPILPCGDLRTAFETALQIGSAGDVLLLSPACASFDQFRDFEDRGDQFKELVRAAG